MVKVSQNNSACGPISMCIVRRDGLACGKSPDSYAGVIRAGSQQAGV